MHKGFGAQKARFPIDYLVSQVMHSAKPLITKLFAKPSPLCKLGLLSFNSGEKLKLSEGSSKNNKKKGQLPWIALALFCVLSVPILIFFISSRPITPPPTTTTVTPPLTSKETITNAQLPAPLQSSGAHLLWDMRYPMSGYLYPAKIVSVLNGISSFDSAIQSIAYKVGYSYDVLPIETEKLYVKTEYAESEPSHNNKPLTMQKVLKQLLSDVMSANKNKKPYLEIFVTNMWVDWHENLSYHKDEYLEIKSYLSMCFDKADNCAMFVLNLSWKENDNTKEVQKPLYVLVLGSQERVFDFCEYFYANNTSLISGFSIKNLTYAGYPLFAFSATPDRPSYNECTVNVDPEDEKKRVLYVPSTLVNNSDIELEAAKIKESSGTKIKVYAANEKVKGICVVTREEGNGIAEIILEIQYNNVPNKMQSSNPPASLKILNWLSFSTKVFVTIEYGEKKDRVFLFDITHQDRDARDPILVRLPLTTNKDDFREVKSITVELELHANTEKMTSGFRTAIDHNHTNNYENVCEKTYAICNLLFENTDVSSDLSFSFLPKDDQIVQTTAYRFDLLGGLENEG